ncbi:MAG: DUF2127 domain-containing protein [Candidatus Freyarchaeota archaeon]|nr:DUF2127 domain-containing protein [Candidatus Jordarchaeia archaeon]MBS7268456.1 DUF2127 domain-containing protein [Candidatus Jordarchaeia archaeon]MBS7280393.1 DUF2127 domain-containing protein [Candidatus Jordarchaeia archaeon]
MSYRPGGVIALAILFFIFGALGIIGGIAIELTVIAQSYTTLHNMILWDAILRRVDFFTLILAASQLSYISMSHFFVVCIVIFSGLYLLAGVGLFMMKNWGRMLALILGILNIVGGIFEMFSLVGIIPLVFGIIVLVYLMGDVKYDFE